MPSLVVAALAGCGPSYSPDTYNVAAVQQANKAEQGVVVGMRPVKISASGTVGTVTGAAAGGIAGAQAVPGAASAFTALGGSLVGGIAGSAVEHATSDTDAFEYIIRKASNDLVSVTQKDKVPLALGQKVLVIAGAQARVIPDYTVQMDLPPKSQEPAKAADAAKQADAPKSPESPKPDAPAKVEPAAESAPPAEKPPGPADLQL